MRWLFSIVGPLILVTLASGAKPPSNGMIPCPQGSAATCNVSKKDLKDGKAAFERGMKLQKSKQIEEAYIEFDQAATLVPRSVEYATTREMLRQELVYEHLERGNADMVKGSQVEAMAEFRSALQLDPQNEFAQQRVHDALGEWAPRQAQPPQIVEDVAEIRVVPQEGRHEFHFRGDSRELFAQVGKAFGVSVIVDDSVMSRRVWFDIDAVDFYTAMRAACDVTHTFWASLEEKQVLVAADTPPNRQQYEQMSLRTFALPGASSPQDLTEVANVMRAVFELRFLSQSPRSFTISVRAPQRTMDAVTGFVENLADSRPEVTLDIHIYQISHSLMRNIGLHIPNQFQLFNIPAVALAGLGGQSIQDLINQFIATGGINQTGSQAISGLLAQLQSQQSSIFSQPLATFGGGLTFFGLSLDTLNAQLSLNESMTKSLEHATLRASQGKDATLHIGSRYPILNASFAPVFNTPAIAQVIQNQSFTTPFPSFNYEDLGLNLKAKPTVHADSAVGLDLEMQIRSLEGASLNGVPIIANREYKGSITVMDGEPAVMAGSVSHSEQTSLNGIPGLGQIPGVNRIAVSNGKQDNDDELLVVITPHVISNPARSGVWLSLD